jgi:hypothetical protein
LLPNEFLAQEFTLSFATNASRIAFAIGAFPTNFVNSTDYGTLTFNVQLTNALGPSATPVNVVTSDSFAVPTGATPVYVGLNLSVNQILDIGTYYLVMSTTAGIPNSSAVLALPQASQASNHYPNVGQLLVANNFHDIHDMMNGCSSSSTVNCAFPPGSTWIASSGPGPTVPMEFQVCSEDGDGCGIFTSPPPPRPPIASPLPSALPLFATGLGVLGLLAWRRKRRAQAAV